MPDRHGAHVHRELHSPRTLHCARCRYLGRATVTPGLDALMRSVPIAKLYDIDESPAVPVQPSKPQASIKVGAQLKAAKFTGKGDRERVLKMYERFQHDAAVTAARAQPRAAGDKRTKSQARRAARQKLAEEKFAARNLANRPSQSSPQRK